MQFCAVIFPDSIRDTEFVFLLIWVGRGLLAYPHAASNKDLLFPALSVSPCLSPVKPFA